MTHPPPPAPVIFAPGLPAFSAASASASASTVETPILDSSAWLSDMHLPSAVTFPPPMASSPSLAILAASPAIISNSALFSSLNRDTLPTISAVECALPVSATTRRRGLPALSGLHPASGPLALYTPNPPCVHAAVSTPDARPNAALSALRAASSTPSLPHSSPVAARTAATVATHHADDAPRPEPSGTSLSTLTFSPVPALPAADIAMWQTAASGAGRLPGMSPSSGASHGAPSGESTRTVPLCSGSVDTVTCLSMAHATAGAPCTTKCSPNSMALPGARAAAGRTACRPVIGRTLPTRTRPRTTRRRRRRRGSSRTLAACPAWPRGPRTRPSWPRSRRTRMP